MSELNGFVRSHNKNSRKLCLMSFKFTVLITFKSCLDSRYQTCRMHVFEDTAIFHMIKLKKFTPWVTYDGERPVFFLCSGSYSGRGALQDNKKHCPFLFYEVYLALQISHIDLADRTPEIAQKDQNSRFTSCRFKKSFPSLPRCIKLKVRSIVANPKFCTHFPFTSCSILAI